MSNVIELQTDIAVIGGGLSGVCAAVAAARQGHGVILCHNRPVPGGNASSEIRVWACGAIGMGNNRYADETGIISEIVDENLFKNPQGNPYIWDSVVTDCLLKEHNITQLLDCHALSCTTENGKLVSVDCYQITTDKHYRILPKICIDATGDADIAWKTGAACVYGVGDQIACEHNSHSLGSSILFYTHDTGKPVKYISPDFGYKQDYIEKILTETNKDISLHYSGCDFWWLEYGGELDVIHESEDIALELRKIIYGIWDYIKNSGKFDAETLTLDWVGSIPGRRESRRAVSLHMLCPNELTRQEKQMDAVCYGGWPIDTHPVSGFFDTRPSCKQIPIGVYDIPLGSLICRDIKNLMLAGRNAGMTHEAMASARVMKTCALMGEAAGLAASLAVEIGRMPHEFSLEQIHLLQQRLIRNDVWIIGRKNDDPDDLARTAVISGSNGIHIDANPDKYIAFDSKIWIILPPLPECRISLYVSAESAIHIHTYASDRKENYLASVELGSDCIQPCKNSSVLCVNIPENPETNTLIMLESDKEISMGVTDTCLPGVLALPSEDGRGLKKMFVPAISISPDPNLFSPANVINGYNRPYGGMNCWAGYITDTSKPYVSIKTESSLSSGHVEMFFDNGLFRDHNNLRPDVYGNGWDDLYGNLIRDITIDFIKGDKQQSVRINDNHLRHICIPFELDFECEEIIVHVERAWNSKIAVIYEIRVYRE